MIPWSAPGRVTRRVVGLFVACAMLPVMLAIALSYGRVQEALLEQRNELLRDAAESYGASLFERLNVADLLTLSIAESDDPGRALSGQLGGPRRAEAVFRAGVIARPGQRAVLGDPTSLPEAQELAAPDAGNAGSAALLVPRRGVWLTRTFVSAQHGARRVALEVDPHFLWGSRDELPYQTDICVLNAQRVPLHCTRTLPDTVLAAIRARLAGEPKGNLAWEGDGTRYLSGYRELFLKGRFGAEAWTIVASQPEEYALAPVHSVKRLVVPVVVLGLLIAAFLGLVQVRRTLGPLKELTDATARIAARDFKARVPVIRDDEFGALASAFNSMSGRLGRQFQALEAHAEIDAVILSNLDVLQVVAIVLRRMSQIGHADKRLLLLADTYGAGTYRIHAADTANDLDGRSIALTESESRRLLATTTDTQHSQIAALTEIGIRHMTALPIVVGGELAGAMVLGYDNDRLPNADEILHLRELADRVAVALATARRDQELHRRAHYDALTQLPNRLLGLNELARAIAASERHGRTLAVLFVDLDGFSTVNDSLGHVTGDALLTQVAERLRHCVRRSDIVSRLGGDEFAVMLPEIRGADDAALVATHVIETLSRPFELQPTQAFISASVGIALFPADGTTAQDLLRHADLAMYTAKQKGRGQFAFFEPSMNAEVQRRLTLERELRQALEEGQFELHYQPQLDLADGNIAGAEALIRWIHPERGMIPPGQFIPFAESSPLIEEIGQWALKAACTQFAAWRTSGLPIDHVSVNVAPRQLRNPGFAHAVAEVIRDSRIPAGSLRLELTETAVIDQGTEVETNLARLAELRVPLELDDFGTGYSSLAYLQRLPVATVKLDLALIRTIEINENNRTVVRAAIDMVHALGKTVVAEGVENAGQLDTLVRMGCNAIQGYYLSRPLPAGTFAQFVRDRATKAALVA